MDIPDSPTRTGHSSPVSTREACYPLNHCAVQPTNLYVGASIAIDRLNATAISATVVRLNPTAHGTWRVHARTGGYGTIVSVAESKVWLL